MQIQNLAERLGYAPDARLVILNCDDLGSSHSANLAAIEAVDRGVATSATLMVPCLWAKEAVELFQGRDVGVHLTLTAEYPTYRWRSLTSARPPCTTTMASRSRAPRPSSPRRGLEDVRAECRAQIDQALAWGVDVTHLDSHMGANQTEPRFYEIYLELAAEYRLPVRMAGRNAEAQLGLSGPRAGARTRPRPPGRLRVPLEGLHRRADEAPGSQAGYRRHRIHPLHPVLDGPELRGYDLDAAQVRVDDHACAMAPDIRQLLKDEGVHTLKLPSPARASARTVVESSDKPLALPPGRRPTHP